jgi:hypothetical protein
LRLSRVFGRAGGMNSMFFHIHLWRAFRISKIYIFSSGQVALHFEVCILWLLNFAGQSELKQDNPIIKLGLPAVVRDFLNGLAYL